MHRQSHKRGAAQQRSALTSRFCRGEKPAACTQKHTARGAWDRIHLPYCDRDRARLPDGCGFSCRAFIKQTRPESGLKLGMVSAALSHHSEMGNAAVSTSHGSRIASDFH